MSMALGFTQRMTRSHRKFRVEAGHDWILFPISALYISALFASFAMGINSLIPPEIKEIYVSERALWLLRGGWVVEREKEVEKPRRQL